MNWDAILPEKTIGDYIAEYEEQYKIIEDTVPSGRARHNSPNIKIETLDDIDIYMSI
jgi:hypothetical protein